MARTQAILSSFQRIEKKRRALKQTGQRLAAQFRQLVDAMGRMLSGFGYRLVERNEPDYNPGRSSTRKRNRLLPKSLKCPKCDRRFSLTMHIARHVNAMHSAKKRSVRKAAA